MHDYLIIDSTTSKHLLVVRAVSEQGAVQVARRQGVYTPYIQALLISGTGVSTGAL